MENIVLKKIGSGVLAFATLFSLVFGIFTWVYEKKPNLAISLVNSFNVLEVKKDLADLVVLYKNEDLEKTGKQIKTLAFDFQNTGNDDILQNMFDQTTDWGLVINNCELISASVSYTSNDYLMKTLYPVISGNRLIINKIILEKNQHFTIEVMLITSKNVINTPSFYGKIAGINCDKIIINENKTNSSQSFFNQLFQGNVLVHFVRLVLYVVIFIIIFFIVVFIIAGLIALQDSFNKWFRKKNIKKILFLEKELKWYGFFIAYYMANGKRKVNKIVEKCKNKELVQNYFELLKKANDKTKEVMLSKEERKVLSDNGFFKKLSNSDAIKITNEVAEINQNFISELKRFTDYLF